MRSVTVAGTRFIIALDSGATLAQKDLVGAVLTLNSRGSRYRLRIDATEPDPEDPSSDIQLYSLSIEDPQTGHWRNACRPDAAGRRFGFPLAGIWTADGRHLHSDTEFSITCLAGAEAKCVRLGYKPWAKSRDGTPLWDYHQACTRLLRSDYCGNGHSRTRDGTLVDIYDRIGIQSDDPAAGMSFEAAWGPNGAICVRRPRFTDLTSLARIARQCPALAGRLGPDCADEVKALLYNKSVPH